MGNAGTVTLSKSSVHGNTETISHSVANVAENDQALLSVSEQIAFTITEYSVAGVKPLMVAGFEVTTVSTPFTLTNQDNSSLLAVHPISAEFVVMLPTVTSVGFKQVGISKTEMLSIYV